jgi:N-acetylglutamate synthase-like GNAT family acetyltransferase
MHNLAVREPLVRGASIIVRPRLSASHVVRPACAGDVDEIAALANHYAADGLMLPRTADEISLQLDDYVVAVNEHGRLLACAALQEYSPSLAEVSSVAVVRDRQGRGLGSAVVIAVERMAHHRGVSELFALTLSDAFFSSLGYVRTSVECYPEKLTRYAALERDGVQVLEKSCYTKTLDR